MDFQIYEPWYIVVLFLVMLVVLIAKAVHSFYKYNRTLKSSFALIGVACIILLLFIYEILGGFYFDDKSPIFGMGFLELIILSQGYNLLFIDYMLNNKK